MTSKLRRFAPIPLVFVLVLGSGVLNLASALRPAMSPRMEHLQRVFPIEFGHHVSWWVSLATGYGLVVSARNLLKRKRRAYWIVLGLSGASCIVHAARGAEYEKAAVSALVFCALMTQRHAFRVRSREIAWKSALELIGIALSAVVVYGAVGFWLLDPRHFAINFHWRQAIWYTFEAMTGSSGLIPQTRYATWFLNSLVVLSIAAIAIAAHALLGPVVYKWRTLPRDRERAHAILAAYGSSPLDFFKVSADKSLFISSDGRCFVSYGVAGGFAIVLGDPVGPAECIEKVIGEFSFYCRDRDWAVGFYQTPADYLPIYRKLGFRSLKIGDQAIVDLKRFSPDEKVPKSIRSKVNQLERAGYHVEYREPPISPELLAELKDVSDDWLQIPGRRERQFSLGRFEVAYVQSSPVFVLRDPGGRALAFVNLIPSYHQGESTVDLMRRRRDVPNGAMEYLFAKLMVHEHERGYSRFNLGMAPMAGFQEDEAATAEERAVHAFCQHLNFIFSFKGLRAFKAKFATTWEPQYAVYRDALDLPRLAWALRGVSELPKRTPVRGSHGLML